MMARNEISMMEAGRVDIGSYYKSQPSALNLAYATIPEDDVWNSSPVVCVDELGGDMEKQNTDGFMIEIDMDDVKPLIPPDGGWGWMIALSSFMCMFLVDGVCFSYGILLSELQNTFGASKMQMALAGSLLTGCYFMTGPIASGLMNRFGARKLVMIGSVSSSIAIFASSFATDVNTFTALFGILGGLGFGLLYLPACTVVTSWFVKKRATVNGIVTAGSGIGITCYSLLIPILIETYTWRGCIILLSALNLHGAVAGALLRPLWKYQPVDSSEKLEEKMLSKSRRASRCSDYPLANSKISIKHLARQVLEAEANRAHANDDQPLHSTTDISDTVYRVLPRRRTSRLSNASTDVSDIANARTSQLLPVPEGTEAMPMLSVEAVNHIVEEVLNRSVMVSTTSLAGTTRAVKRKPPFPISASQRWFNSTTSQLGQMAVRPADTATVYLKPDNAGSASYFASALSLRTGVESVVDPADEAAVREAIVKELRKEVARPVHKKDLFLSGSVMQLNEYVASPNVDAYMRTVTTPAEENQAKNPVRAMLRNMFSVSILRSSTFQLLNLSSVLSMVGYIVPYQFLKDNAQTQGFGEAQSAYLLAYLGILNTISRVLSGILSDRPWIDVILVNNVSLILSGLATALVPVFTTYPSLLFFACFFGFVVAAFIAVRTVLIVKLLGLDRLTNAVGFLLLFQGFAIVSAPPLFGAVYDTLKSFKYIFLFGGIAMVISGLLCLPLKCLMHWEQRKEAQTPEPTDEDGSSNSDLTGFLRRVRDCCRRCRQPKA